MQATLDSGDDDSGDDDSGAPDSFVPDPQVCREFGITAMTLWRWTNDAALRFPPPIEIRKRNFRSRRALEEFKTRMIARGAAARIMSGPQSAKPAHARRTVEPSDAQASAREED